MKFEHQYKEIYERIQPDEVVITDTIWKISNGTSPGKPTWRLSRRILAAAVAVLVCGMLAVPALTAYVPGIYELMYLVSPQIAQKFMPVQMKSVSNGIEMEVVSAYVHGDTAEIYLTMKDLEGERIDGTIDLYDSYNINSPFSNSGHCEFISYDEREKRATFLVRITQWENQDITGNRITFSVGCFIAQKETYENITVLKEFSGYCGNPATKKVSANGGGGTEIPDGFWDQETVTALAPAGAVQSIVPQIDLTAVGNIDGKLHVQICYGEALKNDNHGFIWLEDAHGNKIEPQYGYSFFEEGSGQPIQSVHEDVFAVSPEKLEDYQLRGNFYTSGSYTKGDWRVTFPLEEMPESEH